jgi:hypothetical protein
MHGLGSEAVVLGGETVGGPVVTCLPWQHKVGSSCLTNVYDTLPFIGIALLAYFLLFKDKG